MCCRLARLPASMCPGEPPAPDWGAVNGTRTLIRPLRGRVWGQAAGGPASQPSSGAGGAACSALQALGCPVQCAPAASCDGQAPPLPPPPGTPVNARRFPLAARRFCYHERLSIAGNCRMCLVEVRLLCCSHASALYSSGASERASTACRCPRTSGRFECRQLSGLGTQQAAGWLCSAHQRCQPQTCRCSLPLLLCARWRRAPSRWPRAPCPRLPA